MGYLSAIKSYNIAFTYSLDLSHIVKRFFQNLKLSHSRLKVQYESDAFMGVLNNQGDNSIIFMHNTRQPADKETSDFNQYNSQDSFQVSFYLRGLLRDTEVPSLHHLDIIEGIGNHLEELHLSSYDVSRDLFRNL